MTGPFDLAEFVSAFVAEADEQLSLAGTKILAIEASARKGDRDPRAIRDIFRAMHTIKGLAAMVGIEPIVTVAHAVEAVLRNAERAGGTLGAGGSDLILQAVHRMDTSVRAVERGERVPEPPVALLSALESLASGSKPAAETPRAAHLTLEPSIEQKLDGFERDLFMKGASEGRRALRLDFCPSPERAAQGHTISSVRDQVSALAEIVRVVPVSLRAAEGAPAGIAFALLLLTSASDETLASAAGVTTSAIQSIVAFDAPEDAPVLFSSSPPDELPAERERDAPRRNLLRVDVGRVDDAMDRLAALLVTRSRLARAIAKAGQSGADVRELAQVANENSRNLRDLRASILQVRMVPVSELLDRIPLLLRALTRASGKSARLEVETAGAELDKAVAERVFPALVHLVRNAVDHGIESASERARAGKAPEGVIRIASSARSNGRLELVVADDGGGIDAPSLAQRAGVDTPESAASLLDLLCQPGLSTRDEATMTSGRGMGMDIVRRIVVTDLGGELTLQTEVGRGTTFTLRIPLTVAIVDAFIVECSTERFVVPVSMIEEVIELDTEPLAVPLASSGPSVRPLGVVPRRGETLLVYDLAAVLGLPPPAQPPKKAVVIRRAGQPVGFVVNRIVGQQEAVVRPLLDPLVQIVGIPAATDLGDGRPTLVLDLILLAGQGQRRSRALPEVAAPSPVMAGRAGDSG